MDSHLEEDEKTENIKAKIPTYQKSYRNYMSFLYSLLDKKFEIVNTFNIDEKNDSLKRKVLM